MQRVLFDNQPLDSTEFHAHWRYDRGAKSLLPLDERFFVRDPAVLRSAVRQRGTGNARIPFTHERRNAEVERRARNAQAAVQAIPRTEGAQRGRDRGAGKGKGMGKGRDKMQEVLSSAYIQFQA